MFWTDQTDILQQVLNVFDVLAVDGDVPQEAFDAVEKFFFLAFYKLAFANFFFAGDRADVVQIVNEWGM